MKETIQYTTNSYTVTTSHSNKKSKSIENISLKDTEDLDEQKREKLSSSESVRSSRNQGSINDDNERNKDQCATYDYPRPASIYENSGDESPALYVDGPNDFDQALREYYVRDNSNSPKPKNQLQSEIQENSDNFQNYLRKYGDGNGSTGSTESPAPYSTKSSNDDEEDLSGSNWKRNSEFIETQIRQDINEIDRALEFMSFDFDTPNQFVFDENEYDAINKELNSISPAPSNNSSTKEVVSQQSAKNPTEKDYPKSKPNNSVLSNNGPIYTNVFNITPTINSSRNRSLYSGRKQQRTIKKFPLLSKDFVVPEDKPYSASEAESSTLPNSSASSPTPSSLLQGKIEEVQKDESKGDH